MPRAPRLKHAATRNTIRNASALRSKVSLISVSFSSRQLFVALRLAARRLRDRHIETLGLQRRKHGLEAFSVPRFDGVCRTPDPVQLLQLHVLLSQLAQRLKASFNASSVMYGTRFAVMASTARLQRDVCAAAKTGQLGIHSRPQPLGFQLGHQVKIFKVLEHRAVLVPNSTHQINTVVSEQGVGEVGKASSTMRRPMFLSLFALLTKGPNQALN